MRILVTFATGWEFAPWRRIRSFRPAETGGHPVYESSIANVEVIVLLTGVGPANARQAIESRLEGALDLCIVTGFGGALRPEYLPGDVLVARTVRSSENDRFIVSDEKLLKVAVDCGASAVDGFVSVEKIMGAAHDKSYLGALADAVDMECFPIMSEMFGRGVPAVAVRGIADPVNFDMPCDFEKTLDEHGQVRIGRVLAQVVHAPRALPGLIRLGFASRRAADALARFLERYVDSLAAQKEELTGVPQPLGLSKK